MPPSEFLLGLSVKRFCLNPAVEPRHLIGLLQQRLWSGETRLPENLIPDNTQKLSLIHIFKNVRSGGRIVCIQQLDIELGEVLFGGVGFMRQNDLEMCIRDSPNDG